MAHAPRAAKPRIHLDLPLMKLFLCLVSTLGACALPCQAKPFKLPVDKPAAAIEIPDAWNPTAIQRGYQTETNDKSVYLSVEWTDNPKDMTAIIDETDAMLKTHKVDLNKINRVDNKFKVNGLPAEELLYKGTDENGPALVSITFVTVGKAAVVFTYWASVDGNTKHKEELGKILNSLHPLGT